MTNYIVYTEIHNEDGTMERWYYGTWSNRERANEVALELGNNYPIYHCVCADNEAVGFNILNLPN